ncbi:MAG: hypothetical protein HN350_03885 [Phycisphaerales bacterium]|jgi:hypothetical protein|nr:hypothetical protein [Phycisphaerales bacterium]
MTEVNDIDAIEYEQEDAEEYVPSFEVSCEPMGGKAINFFAMKLVRQGDDRAVLQRILGMSPLLNACTIVGWVIILGLFGVLPLFSDGPFGYLVPLTLVVPMVMAYRMWRRFQPMTFDRAKGLCWPGKNRIDSAGRDHGISIDKIDCIQTLSQHTCGSEDSHDNHELNLVLNDPPGERICVLSCCDFNRFLDVVYDLTEFLDKPRWRPDDADSDE